MLKPLLEVDEFEISDKERWRCKGNNGGVNESWELVERSSIGFDCPRCGGMAGGEGALLMVGEFAVQENLGHLGVRGGEQGIAGQANDSVAIAVAPENIAVVATSAHTTWPSDAAAKCFPRQPPKPILRLRSLSIECVREGGQGVAGPANESVAFVASSADSTWPSGARCFSD
jgi:hypothetical protein